MEDTAEDRQAHLAINRRLDDKDDDPSRRGRGEGSEVGGSMDRTACEVFHPCRYAVAV